MRKALETYLKENIDDKVRISVLDGKSKFPLFISELYDLYEMDILEQTCLLIGIINKAPGLEEIKKHMKVIRKGFDGHVVLSFKSITAFRRKTLIENRIPFVVSDGQMYLPFLGLHLKKITRKNIEPIEKFTINTQVVFLYFLYNKDLQINSVELAKILEISHMTATRILNDLYTLNLLTFDIAGVNGRTKIYQRIGDPDYFLRGRQYLKDPLKQTVYVDKIEVDGLVAGFEALSVISMVNPPKRPIRAISKQEKQDINKYIVKNRDRIADENLVELQIWNYDPKLLSKSYYVDIVSLALTLNEIKDERIEQALEERLKGEAWYME